MYLQPDLNRQRIHKAEKSGWLPTWNLEQDGDTQVHEGLKLNKDGNKAKLQIRRKDKLL